MKKSLRLLAAVGALFFWSVTAPVCFAAPAAGSAPAAQTETIPADNLETNVPQDPEPDETEQNKETSSNQEEPPKESQLPEGPAEPGDSLSEAPLVSSPAEPQTEPSSVPQKEEAKAPAAVQKPVWQAPQASSSEDVSSESPSSVEEEPVSSRVLPDISEDLITSAVPIVGTAEDDGNNANRLIYGIAAWVCIAIAVALVLIVVLGNRNTKAGTKTSGRASAKRRNHPGRKRLLDDKYYQNTKRRYRY